MPINCFEMHSCHFSCSYKSLQICHLPRNLTHPIFFWSSLVFFSPCFQALKEFINEVNTLASLQHPNLCKLLCYHAREGSEPRLLVYERLFHGSLDRLLYGRSDGPPLDWNTRMKVALCTAQGLTFLHEEGPFQVVYYLFFLVLWVFVCPQLSFPFCVRTVDLAKWVL